jgi:hypothetical protein
MVDQLPAEFSRKAVLAGNRRPWLRFLDDGRLQRTALKNGWATNLVPNREAFLRLFADVRPALEIGAFDRCLLEQRDVRHFDVLDQAKLQARAKALKRKPEAVPFIDYVSPHGSLAGIDARFELVISSHSIEHVPDLITHLSEVRNILTATGCYALMIPDCRYCFDHFLPPSTVADVVEAHVERRKVHRLGSVIEHRALTTHNKPKDHWRGIHGVEHDTDPTRLLKAIAEWRKAEAGYIDVHAWQFTPESFRALIGTLFNAGLIGMRAERVYPPTWGMNEFMAVLVPDDSKLSGTVLPRD